MKNKGFILCLLLILGVVVVWIYIAATNTTSNKENILIEKITRLESKIDSLNDKKDSLRIVIDSTHVKIIENEKHYKEVVNNIISQPDSITDLWTKEYINNYRQRLIDGQ